MIGIWRTLKIGTETSLFPGQNSQVKEIKGGKKKKKQTPEGIRNTERSQPRKGTHLRGVVQI